MRVKPFVNLTLILLYFLIALPYMVWLFAILSKQSIIHYEMEKA
jgi:hypothetical protein